jgi:hypothetical protein
VSDEINWDLIEVDPVQADRVLVAMERQLAAETREILESEDHFRMDEIGCSKLSSIFRMLHDEDADVRATATSFLVRDVSFEHRSFLLKIVDDLRQTRKYLEQDLEGVVGVRLYDVEFAAVRNGLRCLEELWQSILEHLQRTNPTQREGER